jgi:hypothetical protein
MNAEGKSIPHLNWSGIWLCFAGYSAFVAILFILLFRERKTAA